MALMELAVDFGSSYITIYKRGEGIVLKEASVVVVSTHKKKREVVESGNAAKNYVKTTMGNAREIYPVREGVVVSVEDASLMMSEFIKRLLPEKIFKPQIRAVVMISSGLTVVERRDVETVMLNAGVKDVVLVESPLALLAYTNSVGGLFLGSVQNVATADFGCRQIVVVHTADVEFQLLRGIIADFQAVIFNEIINNFGIEHRARDIHAARRGNSVFRDACDFRSRPNLRVKSAKRAFSFRAARRNYRGLSNIWASGFTCR